MVLNSLFDIESSQFKSGPVTPRIWNMPTHFVYLHFCRLLRILCQGFLAFASSAEPDEMPPYAAFHLGIHFLSVSKIKRFKLVYPTLSIVWSNQVWSRPRYIRYPLTLPICTSVVLKLSDILAVTVYKSLKSPHALTNQFSKEYPCVLVTALQTSICQYISIN